MKQVHLLCFLLLFLTVSFCAQCQDNDYILYTKQQGLTHNTVTGMEQDSMGYLWISTMAGLNRFDGNRFAEFHGTDSLLLPASNLSGLTHINDRKLLAWARGLCLIDTYTGSSKNLFIPYFKLQDQFKFNSIKAATANAAGDFFVLTNSGFYHFDKDNRLVFRYDHYSSEEADTAFFNFGRKLLWIDPQHLAIVSIAGIYYYNIPRKEFRKMTANDVPLLASFLNYSVEAAFDFFQPVRETVFILNYDSGILYYINFKTKQNSSIHLPFPLLKQEFDYRSNVFRIDDSTFYLTGKLSGFYKLSLNPLSNQLRFDSTKNLRTYYCRRIMRDRNGTVWIATSQGLLKQNKFSSIVHQAWIPADVQAKFPNIVMQDIYPVENRIYVGTRGNAGLLVFDRNSLQFLHSIAIDKTYRQPSSIYSIEPVSQHELLLAVNGPLYKLDTHSEQLTELPLQNFDRERSWIADFYKDYSGTTVWIAAGNLYRYDVKERKLWLVPKKGIATENIVWLNRIVPDYENNLWFAGHGLLRYNTRSESFDKLVDSFPFIQLPDKQINSFTSDDDGNLWINCNNNGLICYNINKGTFLHFTTKDGLPDNNIASMLVVKNKLWMGTFSGVACMDLQTHSIKSFAKENGFPDEPVPIGARFHYDEKNNKLYLGFVSSIVAFDPDLLLNRLPTPKLFIESIAFNNQRKIDFPQKEFSASWHNNEVTVNIGTIDYFTNSTQRFAYRLVKDENTPWQSLGTQRSFTVSNLSPGHHLIQVKVSSNTNQWAEQYDEIDIFLSPPYWKTWWFNEAVLMLVLLILYLLFRWRTQMIRKQEQSKTHLQKLIADEYKNQFELEQISNYFSSSLADKKSVDDVLWDVSKNLIGKMNYEDCMIYLWNDDRTKMIQKASWGPKGDLKAIEHSDFDVLPGQGIVGYVMQTKEPLIVADTSVDPRYRVDDIERLSEICVPILHNGELIGVIDSEHPQPNHFHERDVKILTTIATLIGNKIKQIESEQSLENKQKEIADINQRLAEAQLLALQTQMNPHFIFNSLNSIKRMILEDEQQRASRYMSKFANMLRTTLNQSKQVFTTLYENMEHLENYLSMEKLRFLDSFTFRITADDDIDTEDTLIPTMMLQPLAENAVWHGLMPKKGNKKLLIHFSKKEEHISCVIEDNGIGINHSEKLKQLNRPLHQSVGINNLRNRIKILNEKYNTGCDLEIVDLQDIDERRTGSRATLTFRIIYKQAYESNIS